MKKILLIITLITAIGANAQVFKGVSPSSISGNSFVFEWAEPTGTWSTTIPDFNLQNTFVQDTLELVVDNSWTGNNPAYTIPHPLANEGCLDANGGAHSQPSLAGKIAVVWRGSCQFGLKALLAENNGAVAIVIINHSGTPVGMAGGDTGLFINIPVVMISTTDGQLLLSEMANGPVEVFIGNKTGLYVNDLGSSKDVSNISKYGSVPTSFIQNGLNNFDLGLTITNFGSDDNIPVLNQTITGPSGYSYDTTVTYGLLPAAQDTDYTYIPYTETSLATGEYTINYDLSILTDTTFTTIIDSITQMDSLIQDTTFALIVDTIMQTDSIVQDTIITPIDTTYIDTTYVIIDTLFTTDTIYIGTIMTFNIDTLYTIDTLLNEFDQDISDNIVTSSFSVTNDVLSRARTDQSTGELISNFYPSNYTLAMSSCMHLYEEDLPIGTGAEGIYFSVSSDSTPLSAETFGIAVYEWNDIQSTGWGDFTLNQLNPIYLSDYFFADDSLKEKSVYHEFVNDTLFPEPIKLEKFQRYLVCIQYDGGPAQDIAFGYDNFLDYGSNSAYNPDFGPGRLNIDGTPPFNGISGDWYTGWSGADAPSIGLKVGNYSFVNTNENLMEGSYKLFPNPANSEINISSTNNSNYSNIEIHDLTGRIVKIVNSRISNNTTLDVSDLNSGNYIIKITDNNGKVESLKMIKR